MKRFWLELKSKYTEVNNANNTIITIDKDGLETSYNVPIGAFDPMVLASKVNSQILAKYGEINDEIKKDFLVLFLEENIMYLRGSFIQYLTKGIEQMDMDKNLVNGAESFLPLYIPDGIETTDVSRNPQWNITRLSGQADYIYNNGGVTKNGQLEKLDSLGRLFKVDDRLRDKSANNYNVTYNNSVSGTTEKTKYTLKTNDGTLIENSNGYNDIINVVDVSTDGRYTYFIQPNDSDYSIMVRDSLTGTIEEIANGYDFVNVKKPIELCKNGVNKDKRLLVNYMENEKFYVVVYDLQTKQKLHNPVEVFSDGKKYRPEYFINRDFTKLVYFDQFYTVLTSKDVSVANSQIITTYNIGSVISSLGVNNGRPYLLAVDNTVSNIVVYTSSNNKHRVVMIELATLVARSFYQTLAFTIKDVNSINQFSDGQFIISARIHNNLKGLYCEALISLNVNWLGYQVIEEVKVLSNGIFADESQFYTGGVDLDMSNGMVYVSTLHNLGTKGYFSKTPYPFNEAFSYLRLDQNLAYPYENLKNQPAKYARGSKVTGDIITYANNKTIYKKIL